MAVHHDRAYAAARRQRKAPTRAENALWVLIRGRQIEDLRFRRQMPIGPYIADFCCPSRKLVIEVDGGIHDLREVEDRARDQWLRAHGFVILRFPNETTLSKPNTVLDEIRAHAEKTGEHTPHPSRSASHLPPQGGKEMTRASNPEIWFYHLERSTLDQVLPGLLEKTRERGWRALVRAADERLLDDVDERLWTYRDDSFLAHGRAAEPEAARQPILLTTEVENPNGAQALFILDQSELGDTKGFDRCFIIFDGRDEAAVAAARKRWKTLKESGADLAYWKQSSEGRWEKAA